MAYQERHETMSKYEQFKRALELAVIAPTDEQEKRAVAHALQLLPWLSVRQEARAKAEVSAMLNAREAT